MNKNTPTRQQLIDTIKMLITTDNDEPCSEEQADVLDYCMTKGTYVKLNRGAVL